MNIKKISFMILCTIVSTLMLTSHFAAYPANSNIENTTVENTNPPFSTHTVFAEECSATWCGYCPTVINFLENIWNGGQYDWYYVTLVDDKNSYAGQRVGELGVTGFPTVVYDGGYTRVVGATSQSDHENAIQTCSNRNVADVD